MTLPMYTFDNSIPAGPNNPSADQPDMLSNNQNEILIWQADHFGYNVNSSGYHQQIRMPNYTTYSPPIGAALPSVILGFGGLYCNAGVNLLGGANTALFYTPDATGKAYQLTRTDSTNYPLFGVNVNYPISSPVTNQFGGWTFLPGGLILQYGTMVETSNNTSVTFPVQFPTSLISLTVTRHQNSSSGTSYGTLTENVSGFIFTSNGTSKQEFSWKAIGN